MGQASAFPRSQLIGAGGYQNRAGQVAARDTAIAADSIAVCCSTH